MFQETEVPGTGVDLTGILGDAWRAPKAGESRGIGRGVPSPAIDREFVTSAEKFANFNEFS